MSRAKQGGLVMQMKSLASHLSVPASFETLAGMSDEFQKERIMGAHHIAEAFEFFLPAWQRARRAVGPRSA